MKASEFITEGTEIFINRDGREYIFAKRIAQGHGKGPAVLMFITKDEWEQIKNQRANTETLGYDVATADMIVKDMVKKGSAVIWKTAAEFNADARELENHRFRNDPEVSQGFDQSIDDSRSKASAVTKSSIKSI